MVVPFLKLPTQALLGAALQNDSTATFPPDCVLIVRLLMERLRIL